MSTSTITSKGQITIPKEVRERLGLKVGDRLIFQFDDHGNLLARPEAQNPLGRLSGLLSHLVGNRPVTVEEMNEAIKQRAALRFNRAAQQ